MIKVFKGFLLGIFILVLQQPVLACLGKPCELKTIAETLNQQAGLFQFKQSKQVKVLSKPLNSSGFLLLTEQQGLVWQTTSPIKSTAVINQQSFQQYNKNDQPISLGMNTNNSSGQFIASIFLDILSGDFDQLEENFTVHSQCQNNQWSLELIPRKQEIQKFLVRIQLKGSANIEHLVFEEANEDITHLSFSSLHDTAVTATLRTYLVD